MTVTDDVDHAVQVIDDAWERRQAAATTTPDGTAAEERVAEPPADATHPAASRRHQTNTRRTDAGPES